MIKKVEVYVCESDGARFETEREAIQHEMELRQYDKDIEFYNQFGVKLKPFEACWDEIIYINVKTTEGLLKLNELLLYWNVCDDNVPTSIGLFKYTEWADNDWATPEEYLEYVKSEWAVPVDWNKI